MKTFLLATAALTLAGTGAWAFDDDNRHTRIRVADGHDMAWTQDGTVIEIRGEDGERTIHMQGGGSDATLNINGQDIQIRGSQVFIDGQAVETEGAAIIIIDGDEIRVVNSNDVNRFDGRFEMHMAERAEHFARRAGDMNSFRFDFDSEGLQDEVMASLEAALAGLEREGGSHHWDELSDAEREGARASMREAREEIREAMETLRAEMQEAHRVDGDEMRRVRVELRHATRDAAHAARDAARAVRDEARSDRDEARAMRDEIRGERRHNMHWQSDTDEGERVERNIRVERSEDGRRQVWVDDEEQTGDDLVRWLNQLEAERLAGGPASESGHHERRIIRLNREDGTSREIDLNGRRVIVLRSDDEHNGERVFEFEVEDSHQDAGN